MKKWMYLRKLGLPRKPDGSQRLSTVDPVTLLNLNTTLTHMTILRLPSVSMVDEDAVTAFTTLVAVRVVLARSMIGNIVSCAHHLARGGRQHSDIVFKPTRVRQTKVCALMAIINQTAAGIVSGAGTWVPVNVVLDRTNAADLAAHGKGQMDARVRG